MHGNHINIFLDQTVEIILAKNLKKKEGKVLACMTFRSFMLQQETSKISCACVCIRLLGNRKSFQEIKTTFFCKQGITQKSLS